MIDWNLRGCDDNQKVASMNLFSLKRTKVCGEDRLCANN
jgi:hypothetical protein